MKNLKISKAQLSRNLKDELVLAAILAGAHQPGLFVARGSWGMRVTVSGRVPRPAIDAVPDGPCCAVGCGMIYAGIGVVRSKAGCATRDAFARVYDVSRPYAGGVSDGFEGCYYNESTDPDYWRGREVGEAAYRILLGEERP